MSSGDPAVLIVGGGPVGLTARALLERWGVSTLLVERHTGLSPFPRARLVNVRSMEILRGLGLAEKIAARAFRPEFACMRFSDTLLGPDYAMSAMIGARAPIAESPVMGVVTSQDRLEPLLASAADAKMRFGVELTDLEQDTDSVCATLVDRETGATSRVRARYVIAADGARSTIRERLQIPTAGPGAIMSFTTVVFDADLEQLHAERPAGVYFTLSGGFLPIYPEGTWAWFLPTPQGAARIDWSELLMRELGQTTAAPKVLRVQQWTLEAFVADRFREGRVLLAGDAVHPMPIQGGLGMNTGIADAHNLAWKLAGILHGWAGPEILDSYERERRPVALRTVAQAAKNASLAGEVLARRRERLASGAAGELELPWSDRYFAQLGLILGMAYESDAVVSDGTPAPTDSESTTDYVPTARPGHRLPHVWLADGRSSLDAIGESFVLFSPAPRAWSGWELDPWPLTVESLPQAAAEIFALGPTGAILVRPDGHIAARWADGPPNATILQHALATITSSE